MIPAFNDSGYLPPGVHRATLDEIEARFGRESELRQVQMESVRWMASAAVRAGARRIILNGSFVTDKYEPNDVDCAILIELGFPDDADAGDELNTGFPFIELKLVRGPDFDVLISEVYGSDRMDLPKGIIEVIL